jgi:hypothetical protein
MGRSPLHYRAIEPPYRAVAAGSKESSEEHELAGGRTQSGVLPERDSVQYTKQEELFGR